MYRDERVIFVVNAACLFFVFFPPSPLMYRLEVCLFSLYMLRLSVGVRMKTERQSYRLGSEHRRRRWSSKWMFKNKNKGRKEGGWGLGEEKTYPCTVEDGPGRRFTPSFNSLGLCKCIVSKVMLHVSFFDLSGLLHYSAFCALLSLSLLSSLLLIPYTLPLPLSAYPSLSLCLLIGLWILL